MKSPLEHIEHIRTKPHHVRRRFAVLFTFLIGGSIFLTWLSHESDTLSLVEPDTTNSFVAQNNQQPSIGGSDNVASPLGAFKSFFGGANNQ